MPCSVLPPEPAPVAARGAPAAASGAADDRTVFVAGCDAAVLDSLSLLLRSGGQRTVACRDGTALLGALERRGGQQRPGAACVVLDHHHPGGLDAVGLLARMAAAGAVLPVAVATDSSDQRLTAELRRLGAAAVLEKPLLQEALFRAVLRLLGSDGHHAAAAPLPPLRAPRR